MQNKENILYDISCYLRHKYNLWYLDINIDKNNNVFIDDGSFIDTIIFDVWCFKDIEKRNIFIKNLFYNFSLKELKNLSDIILFVDFKKSKIHFYFYNFDIKKANKKEKKLLLKVYNVLNNTYNNIINDIKINFLTS